MISVINEDVFTIFWPEPSCGFSNRVRNSCHGSAPNSVGLGLGLGRGC